VSMVTSFDYGGEMSLERLTENKAPLLSPSRERKGGRKGRRQTA